MTLLNADVGSVVSSITYAFYLDGTLKNSQFCSVPVVNMKRTDLVSHTDLHWLLHSCHIDLSSLIFIDEVHITSLCWKCKPARLLVLSVNKSFLWHLTTRSTCPITICLVVSILSCSIVIRFHLNKRWFYSFICLFFYIF